MLLFGRMLSKIVTFSLLLFLLINVVSAADPPQGSGQGNTVALVPASTSPVTTVDQANKFLAAEVTRQMKQSQEEMLAALSNTNDINFIEFDKRVQAFTVTAKQQIIIGGIGAVLVANALIGLALIWVFRRYSYEYYQQKMLEAKEQEIEAVKRDLKGFQELQQPAWNMQQPQQTVGMQYGQQMAGDMSMMNQWQTQPAYAGSWTSPQETSKEYAAYERSDPMAKPWTMRGV